MRYLTPKQVCEITGLKYSTVLLWAQQGILPVRRIVNKRKSKYLFPEKETIDAIESHAISKV